MDYVAFDIETTGLERLAKVIGFSYYDGKVSQYIVHLQWDGNKLVEITPFQKCVEILESLKTKKLIMFNAHFDISRTKTYFGVDLTDALHCDVMLQAHLNDENLMSYGLKQLGKLYLGIEPNEQSDLKAALKAIGAKEFYKAPTKILSDYAKQDVKLTLDLFNRLPQPELLYSEIMPLLRLVVIPMQMRGVALNLEELKRDQADITKDLLQLEINIQNKINRHLGPFRDWFYEKNYPVKSRGKMASMLKANPTFTLRQAQQAAFKLDGGGYEFNILSKDHLKRLFFDILKCTPLSYTPSGQPQVDNDFLETIGLDFAKDLTLYNKLTKIKGTYIDRFITEQEDGIFYPAYFMHRTVSGRLSGDMQQLPRPMESGHELVKKYCNKIRAYFIARPGHVFIDNDYNSLEPRIFASLAGDETLLDIFKNNFDFYSAIGIQVYKLEKFSAQKDAPNYLGNLNKEVRQRAKAFSLGIRYGMTDYKLHKDLNISQNEAKAIISNYFKAFPKLAESMESVRKSILTKGEISTKFGRIRRCPDAVGVYKRHGPAILNALELWKKYNDPEPNEIAYKSAKLDYKVIQSALNNAYNHEIQGMAAHILNRASIAFASETKKLSINAHIIASIHDELVIECSEEDSDRAAVILQKIMENTTKLDGVDLIAEPSFGLNLRDSK